MSVEAWKEVHSILADIGWFIFAVFWLFIIFGNPFRRGGDE